ncbi:MAG: LLM class flavin-dependent oxidoreductase [Ilumatobacteraceae bacterium]|uniref:LLM class flavin-dependent oxidoreductase n=1 Tax=Ilumatobacter fluminis TaxID=467091 RepID=UPI0029677DDB|nr:LLM class flavin-dependent oxidoreductase [Ilumatobacteraceae bacterium]
MSEVRKGVVLQGVDRPADLVSMAREFERLGFDHLWMTDSSLHARDPYQMLALAASATQRLVVGTAVTNPISRHPALTAVSAATLAEVSNGRSILGIGAGDRPLVALGRSPAKLTTLESSIAAIRRLAAGEHVDVDTEVFSLVDAHLRFPAQADIPVYISATGPRTLELSGRIADGVILLCGLEPRVVRWAIEHIDRGATQAGRPRPKIAVFAYGIIDEDEQAAIAGARTIAAWFPQTSPQYCDLVGLDPAIRDAVRESYTGGEFQEAAAAAALLPDDFVQQMALAGGRERATAQLRSLAEVGVDSINVFPLGDDRMATIEAFCECFDAAHTG